MTTIAKSDRSWQSKVIYAFPIPCTKVHYPRYVVALDSMGNPQEEGDILRALTPDEWAEKYGIN